MLRPTSTRVRRTVLAAAVATLAPLAAVAGPSPVLAAAQAEPAPAVNHLWAPEAVTGLLTGRRQLASVELGVRFVAGESAVEIWSTRTSYDEPIRSVVRTASGAVELPVGSMPTFGGLRKMLAVTVTDARTGAVVRRASRDGCLGGYGQRVRPDAPARSPYPAPWDSSGGGCQVNPYSLGTVQGVQAGWANQLLSYGGALRLPAGRYLATVTVRPRYAAALGLTAATATRTLEVEVAREHDHDDHDHGSEPGHRAAAVPAGTAPTGPPLADVTGPVPNLKSLPAWGIDVSRNGDYLRFSATVWNAGDSPLVVDGFPGDREDRMDAYQYFFDADGTQTGYQPVGSFEYDRKRTHQHWHFRDFASYTLLRADQTTAVTSRKEAFCLANTDAVDLTVPSASWNPGNTDLSTDCGAENALSLRQVLAAGWGDTYAQFRAGQSFDLRGLPNGTYYIATTANPRQRLVESSTDDNVALRKVVIGGRGGARTVRVPQVGTVVETDAVEGGLGHGH
ncbi:MAG: hypothetical protein JWN84_2003 [Nocardioides sp.]|nr:hypothetical protein [Nocardioides sp.]